LSIRHNLMFFIDNRCNWYIHRNLSQQSKKYLQLETEILNYLNVVPNNYQIDNNGSVSNFLKV